jgi:hypothetical protein
MLMGYDDYVIARKLLLLHDPPFYALIQAAMRKADSGNAVRLWRAFPEVWVELNARYNAPGGKLPGDEG